MTWNKNDNIKDAACWLSELVKLVELKHRQITTKSIPRILRGGVFNVELGEGNIGGEKNKKRPSLVISHNNLNKGDTVVIIPLTTKFKYIEDNGIKKPCYANHYILHKANHPFLSDDSCVKCEDIRMVDKVRLKEHLGNISLRDLNKIKSRMEFTFGFRNV